MVKLRAEKVARIANFIPEVEPFGASEGELLVVGWGSTFGAITTAVERVQRRGGRVSSIHLRYLNPFPRNLEDVLKNFEKVLVVEMNLGQLRFILQGTFGIKLEGLNKVQGQPFRISEIEQKIEEMI
jgi:2-oxoglutarate ferredoxin oxidoreductase subunit alpha